MKTTMNFGFRGEYRLEKLDANGNVLFDSGVQQNVVLDQAIDGLLKNVNDNYQVRLGSGNSTPDATQTGLDNFVITAFGSTTNRGFRDFDNYQYAIAGISGATTNSGTTYNVSEIGLYDFDTSTYVTRALIKDDVGNPVTISVTSEQQLRVSYFLRMEQDIVNLVKSTTATIKGQLTTIQYGFFANPWYDPIEGSIPNGVSTQPGITILREAFDQTLVDAVTVTETLAEETAFGVFANMVTDGSPLTTGVANNVNSDMVTTYDTTVPNQITLTIDLGAEDGVATWYGVGIEGGATDEEFGNPIENGYWHTWMLFDPPFVKENTETMSFSVSVAVANGPIV